MSDYENEPQFQTDPETENEEKIKRIQKRSNAISLFLILAIVAGFFIFNLISKKAVGQAGFTFDPEGMTVTDRDGNETYMAFADVTEIVFVEDADYGEPLNGSIVGILNSQWMQGTFSSDYFGKYTASCDPRVSAAIWFKTADMSYVINRESAETTKLIYEQLIEITGIQP